MCLLTEDLLHGLAAERCDLFDCHQTGKTIHRGFRTVDGVVGTDRLGADVLDARHFEHRTNGTARDNTGTCLSRHQEHLTASEHTGDLVGDGRSDDGYLDEVILRGGRRLLDGVGRLGGFTHTETHLSVLITDHDERGLTHRPTALDHLGNAIHRDGDFLEPVFDFSVAGSILGSSDDGKISANNDGTGSVNGWSNKLDKQTGVTTYKQAYVKDKNGTQEMVDINPTGSDAIENLLARYYTSGRLRVGDPVDNKDAVHKKYVDDGFIAKQTGETTYPKVYGKDADGSQSLVEYSSTVRNAALVQRSGLGQVAVPDTPTDNSHATSKIYVDNKLTATLTQLQDGTYSLTFGV